MTAEDSVFTLCRLLAAWVNQTGAGAAPADFDALLRAAKRHMLTAAACAAMEAAGWMELCPPETAKQFQTARLGAVRKTLLMDAERREILAALEETGIWYAPLKGIVVNAIYPQYGTREFADNDILFDAARWKDVRKLMRRRGFAAAEIGLGSHDVYHKPPLYSFEMHRKLFSENGKSDFLRASTAYYADARSRMIKDAGNGFGYHFSDEDFYVYFIAHAYKHYDCGGTGLRTLLDVYLYRQARPELDARRVAEGLEALGLTEFEGVFRALAGKLFGPEPCLELSEREREALGWMESSGVYGTAAHRVAGELRRLQGDGGPVTARTRALFLFRRFFPEWEWYRVNAPFVYRHRWALPFFWVYRLGRGVIVNGRRNLREAGEACARPRGNSRTF